MKFITHIQAKTPLSFRNGRDKTSAATLDFIPGTVLLGGLAQSFSLTKGQKDQLSALFLGQTSSFSNQYPANIKQEKYRDYASPVYPIPATARSCKRFPGFKSDHTQSDECHGVRDALLDETLYALSKQKRLDIFTHHTCPLCEQPFDHLPGYCQHNIPNSIWTETSIEKGIRTRNGINRGTGAVQSGILYSREHIQMENQFWGTVDIPDTLTEPFKDFINSANELGLIHLGNNRTRGFGKVIIHLYDTSSISKETLKQKILGFDQALRILGQTVQIETPHELYIPITLKAGAIIYDHLLRYQSAIEADYLDEVWGISGADLIYSNSKVYRVMGWNDMLSVPRSDEIGINKGSVYIFGIHQQLTDTLLDQLYRMQTRGIGARCREGFGQIEIANPFHWEGTEL